MEEAGDINRQKDLESQTSNTLNMDKDKTSNKKSVLLVVGLILALLVLGTVSWVGLSKIENRPIETTSNVTGVTPSASPTLTAVDAFPTLGPTAGWESYSHEAFSFKYPQSFSVASSSLESNLVNLMADFATLAIYTDPEYKLECVDLNDIKQSQVTIDGKTFTKRVFKGTNQPEESCAFAPLTKRYIQYEAKLGEQRFDILYSYFTDHEAQALAMLEQIITTFDFVQ